MGVSLFLFSLNESPNNDEMPQEEQNDRNGGGNGASPITSEELIAALKDRGFDLKEADVPSENAFARELNGIPPQLYFLEGHPLSIYIFPTIEASIKGIKDFEEKTESAGLEPYKTFTNNNLLAFYVEGSGENNQALQKVINNLDTSQSDQALEADDVTNFIEFKGEVSQVEHKDNYQKVLVLPDVKNNTIDYEKAWFTIENNSSYKPGQSVLVNYDTTQVHTSQFPPHYGAEKIKIIKD